MLPSLLLQHLARFKEFSTEMVAPGKKQQRVLVMAIGCIAEGGWGSGMIALQLRKKWPWTLPSTGDPHCLAALPD